MTTPSETRAGKLQALAEECRAEAGWHRIMNSKYSSDTEHIAMASDNEVRAMKLEALAASEPVEAVPFGYVINAPNCRGRFYDSLDEDHLRILKDLAVPVYTAPPAAVSVDKAMATRFWDGYEAYFNGLSGEELSSGRSHRTDAGIAGLTAALDPQVKK